MIHLFMTFIPGTEASWNHPSLLKLREQVPWGSRAAELHGVVWQLYNCGQFGLENYLIEADDCVLSKISHLSQKMPRCCSIQVQQKKNAFRYHEMHQLHNCNHSHRWGKINWRNQKNPCMNTYGVFPTLHKYMKTNVQMCAV